MTHEVAVHATEADLRRLGWVVYRRVLGDGPDLAIWRDWWGAERGPVLVTVKRPKPAKGRLYPRLERLGAAEVLANVLEDRIEYLDHRGHPLSLSDVEGPSRLYPRGVGGAVQDGPLPARQPAE